MATRELTVTIPDDLVSRMQAGELEVVAGYLGEMLHEQVREAAIRDYLQRCETAGHSPITDADLREFRKLVGEEAS